jgi:arylsulfatase A-like enzyme
MEGSSLKPLWTSDGEYGEELSISEMWRDHRHIIAVRTKAFKYIWDSRHPDKSELYDIEADPDECHNLINKNLEQAAYFQRLVDDHLARVESQGISDESAEPELDADLIRRLRDLGYVE